MSGRPYLMRRVIFGLLCIGSLTTAAVYVVSARRSVSISAASGPHEPDAIPANVLTGPVLLFRSAAIRTNGTMMLSPLDRLTERYATGLRCERIHHSGGAGLCLTAERGFVTRYRAVLFNQSLRPVHELPLPGIPSRARVSPDGRVGALTVFVSGDSYAASSFSTRTWIVDMKAGAKVMDLEQLTVQKEGRPFASIDFNYWGVTFARDNSRFYVTLGTAGQRYLVRGDLRTRTGEVIGTNVECPSLSPDGGKIVFKRRRIDANGRLTWGLVVLQLATGTETPLALEPRSVDDQVEWMDDLSLLYGLPNESFPGRTNVWRLSTAATGAPELLLSDGDSPAVGRLAPSQ